MIDMQYGQRLCVTSLVEAKQGRRIIHFGQKVHILKDNGGSYSLGKDLHGEFKTVLANASEGVHFELIHGEIPFPEKTNFAPLDFSCLFRR